MKSIWMKVAMVLAASFFAMNVTACNTTRGAGQDIERAGDAIEDAAD
jgi:predicted small secreted protein